jgi:dihydroorotase
MTELATFAQNRHVRLAGFADGKALNNVVLLRRSLEYTHSLQRPLALWPCDRALVGNGIARDGAIALMGGLPGIPSAAETAAIAMILELVREIGTPVHLMRISTARSVELVARAKQEGLPITASTTWLHLLFSTQDILTYDPSLRLDPPLGNPEDVAALVDAVKSGTIDAIALDHHPYTYEEKTVAFGDAPPGAIGLSIAFAALWQRFVEPGEWTALELMRAMSLGPARCLNLAPSCLAVGQPMEAFLFDPHTEWVVDKGTVRTPALNTPFLHQSLTGKVLRVWPVTSISHSGMQIA